MARARSVAAERDPRPRTPAKASGRADQRPRWRKALQRVLGPGLITGASDDDPSGIATYSQAGAQQGFAVSWTMLFTYPLMAAIQEISARVGRTTGHGIAGNLRRNYSPWLLHVIVVLLFVSNTINIGADLGAMGEALALVAGGPRVAYVVGFGVLCAALEIWLDYRRYAPLLRWLTLSLLAYFGTLLAIELPWGDVLKGLLIPTLTAGPAFWTTLVAILGTTISPYLFFWQASQEVEEIDHVAERKPLVKAPEQAPSALNRIRWDTYAGMAFSNLVALAIVVTAAATLHRAGVTDIDSATKAAEALRPVAGPYAFAIFTFGIIGTGLLAVPVLAGSAAYALGEANKWPIGLARKPHEAKAFYASIAVATMIGALLNLSPINPIKALYWSAVLNGIVAVPLMVILMLMTGNPRVMGRFVIGGPLRVVGWAATLVMAASAVAMVVTTMR